MKEQDSPRLTWRLLFLSLLLSVIGLIFVFEASVAESFNLFGEPYHFVRLQAIRLVVGLVALGMVKFLPLKIWSKLSGFFYLGAVILLVMVFIPGIGAEFNGARRWLSLGGMMFQPVEVAKLGIVVFYSSWMKKHQKLAPFLFLTAVPSLLLILQPDFGSLLIILSIALGLFFTSGGNLAKLLPIGGVTVLGLSLLVLSSPYRMERLQTFINPESDPLGSSFHIRQIVIALGRGSWIGQGIGRSRQKFAYIPEVSSDSIFAIVGEEIGLVGSLLVILLFAYYLHLGLKIARTNPKNSFAYLLATGIVIWVGAQTILNLAAVVALVPLTGIPLPFFSYGGTSLITVMIGTGLLLSCEKR